MTSNAFARFSLAAAAAGALSLSAAADALSTAASTAGVSAGLTEEEQAIGREWAGKVGFGFNAQGGNTTQSGVSGVAEAKKLEGQYVVIASAEGGWEEKRVTDADGSERDERTVGFAEAGANVKRRFEEGFFLYGDLSGRNDDIAGVKYRFAESVGLGTFLVDEEGLKFSVEAGLAEVQEKLEGSSSDEYTAVRLAERADWIPEWGENVSFFESAEWLCDVDDSDHWFAKAEAGIDIPMALDLSLGLKAGLEHENQPAAGKEKTDRRVTAQIGWTF